MSRSPASFVVTFRIRPNTRKLALHYSTLPDEIKSRVAVNLKNFALAIEKALKDKLSGASGGVYAPNNPLWSAIKGSGKAPLFNTGIELASKITHVVKKGHGENYGSVEVGWLESMSMNDSVKSSQQVVSIITRGRTWTPTKKQRAAFWAKVPKEIKAANWESEGVARKDKWHIPSRPFVREVQRDKRFRDRYTRIMRRAAQQAVDRLVAKAKNTSE